MKDEEGTMTNGEKPRCYEEQALLRQALQEHLTAMLDRLAAPTCSPAAFQTIALSTEAQAKLLDFLLFFLETNRVMNLSAITEPEEVMTLHVEDSLSLLPLLDRESKGEAGPPALLDIGTGAGFPALPLKIARPDLQVYMVDGLAKRLRFIDRVIERLDLPPVCHTEHGRAEELGRLPAWREKFPFVTARALAHMPILLEYCLPFVKVGGLFCAMKAQAEQEVEEGQRAAEILGARREAVLSFTLPGTDVARSLVLYRKERPTPARYPRPNGKIKKQPL